MKHVISYLDQTINNRNGDIERYKTKGPVHENPTMVTWYKERAKTTAYEIQELEFIRSLIKKEQAAQELYR